MDEPRVLANVNTLLHKNADHQLFGVFHSDLSCQYTYHLFSNVQK